MNPLQAELLVLMKPAIKHFFDNVVVPDLKALEDKIGSDTVKQVVEQITASIEGVAEAALE